MDDVTLDKMVVRLDELGSMSVQLDALPKVENLADVQSIKSKVEDLQYASRKSAGEIAELAKEIREGLEARTAMALVTQARLILADIERKSEVILRDADLHSIEMVSKVEEKEFDFPGLMAPVVEHWGAIGKDVRRNNGGVVIRVPGHSITLTAADIDLKCEDQTGLRRLVQHIAEEHPFDVIPASNELWDQFSPETQEILKTAHDVGNQRIKALKKAEAAKKKEAKQKAEPKSKANSEVEVE